LRNNSPFRISLLLGSLLASAALAQGSAVLTGVVSDAATGKPVPDVVVTATSPALQGEKIVVTDASGTYRIPQLPPGTYMVRLEKEAFRPYSRTDIQLRVDRTVRLNIQMQPEALKAEEVVVVGRPPTIDVGSSTTGVNVGQDFIRNVAVIRPGAKRSGTRSFESLAEVAPGVNADDFGFSVAGTSSPENQFVIDGLSVNDPAFGTLGTALSVEFVQDVNVITGGYMPEYGRATGGVMNVVTKSGSNEFHGSVFGNWAPGALEGSRREIKSEGSSIRTNSQTWNVGDFGAEIGGPIIKDKLWFFAGFNPSFSRYRVRRSLHEFTDVKCNPAVSAQVAANNLEFGTNDLDPCVDGIDNVVDEADIDANGDRATLVLPNSERTIFADQRSYQYIGKLTYLINSDHNISLSVYGAPTSSGGVGQVGIDPKNGALDNPGPGQLSALSNKYISDSSDVALKYAASFLDKKVLLDVTLGWHHQSQKTLPSDGSAPGSGVGLADAPQVIFRRTDPHSILDFEDLNDEATGACAKPTYQYRTGPGADEGPQLVAENRLTSRASRCPVSNYAIGGPGPINSASLDRYQARAVGTLFLTAAGHHSIKAGVDVEVLNYNNEKGYTGGVAMRESTGGGSFTDLRGYGYIGAPDVLVRQLTQVADVGSTSVGGFLQDSWNIVDLVTLNAGLRLDQQTITGADGNVGMVLNNQISPRVGLVYDFTQEGRSKIYANYARYYESVPMDMADRSFPGERQASAIRARLPSNPAARGNVTGEGTPQGCDPLSDLNQVKNQCADPNNYILLGTATDPSQYVYATGGDRVPVDPGLQPQSSDEIAVGGEYELVSDGRIGVNYSHRYMNNVIEDMSRDEGNTYFIGNPGSGLAKDFPVAKRDYDAVTVYFNKAFSDLWLAQVSYTWSYNRGNYAGLFRPETLQLDPNVNSDFDLISLLPNRDGPLPGNRTHVIKIFGAKEFVLTGSMSFNVGLTYKGRSGTPIEYLGSHIAYGSDEVFVLPRGSGGELPWIHTVDARAGFNYKFTKDNMLQVSVDIFNMFNFDSVTQVDQRFTSADVLPLQPSGTKSPQEQLCIAGNDPTCETGLRSPDGVPIAQGELNKNYKQPLQYQNPLSVRFGVRVSF
jgi:hypothetical protein